MSMGVSSTNERCEIPPLLTRMSTESTIFRTLSTAQSIDCGSSRSRVWMIQFSGCVHLFFTLSSTSCRLAESMRR